MFAHWGNTSNSVILLNNKRTSIRTLKNISKLICREQTLQPDGINTTKWHGEDYNFEEHQHYNSLMETTTDSQF